MFGDTPTGIPIPDKPGHWLVPPWPTNAIFSDVVRHFMSHHQLRNTNTAHLVAYFEGFPGGAGNSSGRRADGCPPPEVVRNDARLRLPVRESSSRTTNGRNPESQRPHLEAADAPHTSLQGKGIVTIRWGRSVFVPTSAHIRQIRDGTVVVHEVEGRHVGFAVCGAWLIDDSADPAESDDLTACSVCLDRLNRGDFTDWER